MTPDLEQIYTDLIEPSEFLEIVKKRHNESETFFNKSTNKKRGLKAIRDDNRKQYLAGYVEEQLVDDRYQEVFADNRQFIAVRTIVPFITEQITAPEITPANKDLINKLFAQDFENVLQMHAEEQHAKHKIRLVVQDLLIGERIGIGKWRYDAAKDNIIFEHLSPDSVMIGKRSSLYEEPDYLSQKLKRTPGDLIKQFPDQKDKILELFGVADNPVSLSETEYTIKEDWLFIDVDDEKKLVVGWRYKDHCFGVIDDPNWDEGGKNLTEFQMMPFVWWNLLNDGTTHIDHTSFSEQSKYLQQNYNKRGQVIAESAKYGGTGVPIFAKGSITQKDVSKIHFSPIQRVLLDTQDVNKSFTVWQQQNMPTYIIEDKQDLKASIEDIYGAPNVMQGHQTNQNTATQDLILKNQGQGRQSDLLDCLEVGMTRFYQLEAQMMYRYFTDEHYYNYMGDDGNFVSIVISKPKIAQNLGIKIGIKAGTSLPIDRAQKRMAIMDLLKMNKVSTLVAYRELGLFDDPEEAYNQFVKEQVLPFQAMDDAEKNIQDREAEEDLQAVIAGKKPVERDDISDDYIKHLNAYLLTNKYHMLQPDEQKNVQNFVQQIIGQVKLKMAKMQDQQETDNPNTKMPPIRAKETFNYRDAPPDVQAQMEINQGLQPSALHDLEMTAGMAHVGTNTSTIIQPNQSPQELAPTPPQPQQPQQPQPSPQSQGQPPQ